MPKLALIHDNKIIEYRDLEWSDIPEHKKYLWREVVDNIPKYNESTQYIVGPEAKITNTHVIFEYYIHNKSKKWQDREKNEII